MASRAVGLAKDTLAAFIDEDALTRAAGIAYFSLFSLGPLLFIATGVAGLIFGEAEVRAAMAAQLRDMLGEDAAGAVHEMAQGALGDAGGGVALAIGLGTLLLTASGAFGALQAALNAIWKTSAPAGSSTVETITVFVRAKAAAMGLVATTAFLLLVSLAASAALTAFGTWIGEVMPGLEIVLRALSLLLSVTVITALFAAIYKVLPDRPLGWRDVGVGAFATAVLFTLGKLAIGIYIGQSGTAESFGTAGTIVVVLLWLYYSAVIFLLGACFTRAWSGKTVPASQPTPPETPRPVPVEPTVNGDIRALAVAGGVVLVVSLIRFAWKAGRITR